MGNLCLEVVVPLTVLLLQGESRQKLHAEELLSFVLSRSRYLHSQRTLQLKHILDVKCEICLSVSFPRNTESLGQCFKKPKLTNIQDLFILDSCDLRYRIYFLFSTICPMTVSIFTLLENRHFLSSLPSSQTERGGRISVVTDLFHRMERKILEKTFLSK